MVWVSLLFQNVNLNATYLNKSNHKASQLKLYTFKHLHKIKSTFNLQNFCVFLNIQQLNLHFVTLEYVIKIKKMSYA